MEDYQARVIEEKKSLDEKISKLDKFLSRDGVASSIGLQEYSRMRRQLNLMNDYSSVLEERISVW